ncbi:hypothetical protein KL931_004923 [Ogataea haglerorum]|nr:hypothetical protein KL931_004923 [Ogataea haglerorum]
MGHAALHRACGARPSQGHPQLAPQQVPCRVTRCDKKDVGVARDTNSPRNKGLWESVCGGTRAAERISLDPELHPLAPAMYFSSATSTAATDRHSINSGWP